MASRSRARSRRPSLQLRFFAIAAIASLALFAFLSIGTNLGVILAWVLAWTAPTFLLYGYDKLQARSGRLRVPEISLLGAGAAGGFAGAIGGMLLFRHKTAKSKFWLVNIASGVLFIILMLAVS